MTKIYNLVIPVFLLVGIIAAPLYLVSLFFYPESQVTRVLGGVLIVSGLLIVLAGIIWAAYVLIDSIIDEIRN